MSHTDATVIAFTALEQCIIPKQNLDSSDDLPNQAEICQEVIREQIEILHRYKERMEVLDPQFVGSHAQMIVQLCDEIMTPHHQDRLRRPFL